MTASADSGPTPSPIWRGVLLVTGAAAMTAALVALRIETLGQSLNPRTALVLAVAALGAALSALAAHGLNRWIQRRWPRLPGGVLLAGLFLLFLFPAAALVHSVMLREFVGPSEVVLGSSLSRYLVHKAFSHAGTVFLFLTTGLTYFLPWPAPLAALALGALARRLP